jgi:hypothetical protein
MPQTTSTKQAAEKRRQEAAARKGKTGVKIVEGDKKKPVASTFDQSKHRPKGGLGGLAKSAQRNREQRQRIAERKKKAAAKKKKPQGY